MRKPINITANDGLRASSPSSVNGSLFSHIIRKAKLKMSDTILRYKYLAIDDSFKDEFAKGSLSIIRDGKIKFANPDRKIDPTGKVFNDPFDCNIDVDAIAIYKSIEKRPLSSEDKRGLDLAVQQNGKLSPANRLLKRNELLAKNRNSFLKNYFEINKTFGICCLSRNPLNLLMWAHYAKDHTGYVIEFEISNEIPTAILIETDNFKKLKTVAENLYPLPINYEEEKPLIDTLDKEAFFKHFLTKGKDWEYEEEERVIDYIRGPGFHRYDRKKILKSVIAGMRMEDDDFATLKKAVETVNQELGINVTLHKAEPLKGKFALHVPDREDLNIHNKFDKTNSL